MVCLNVWKWSSRSFPPGLLDFIMNNGLTSFEISPFHFIPFWQYNKCCRFAIFYNLVNHLTEYPSVCMSGWLHPRTKSSNLLICIDFQHSFIFLCTEVVVFCVSLIIKHFEKSSNDYIACAKTVCVQLSS